MRRSVRSEKIVGNEQRRVAINRRAIKPGKTNRVADQRTAHAWNTAPAALALTLRVPLYADL
jgi:hypothetical protein